MLTVLPSHCDGGWGWLPFVLLIHCPSVTAGDPAGPNGAVRRAEDPFEGSRALGFKPSPGLSHHGLRSSGQALAPTARPSQRQAGDPGADQHFLFLPRGLARPSRGAAPGHSRPEGKAGPACGWQPPWGGGLGPGTHPEAAAARGADSPDKGARGSGTKEEGAWCLL